MPSALAQATAPVIIESFRACVIGENSEVVRRVQACIASGGVLNLSDIGDRGHGFTELPTSVLEFEKLSGLSDLKLDPRDTRLTVEVEALRRGGIAALRLRLTKARLARADSYPEPEPYLRFAKKLADSCKAALRERV